MKANYKFFAALLAMVFLAAAANAQTPSRRNSGSNNREDAKVERQQTKVDKGQKPTNINNPAATYKKVRDSQSDRNGFGGNRPSGDRPSGNGGFGNGNDRPSGDRPSGNGGFGNGNNRPSGDRPSGNGGFGNGNDRPSGDRPSGDRPSNNGGFGNGRDDKGRFDMGRDDHRYGDKHRRRPEMSPIINYSRNQIYERTNASSIVVSTLFSSRKEAYDYIEWLLDQKAYYVESYGNNYSWLQSDVTFVPTPFDWTNPMTHNQFRMKFNISRSGGVVKVTITGQWRESFLSSSYTKLRFQPSDKYSTYYAWNVLEDFASSIPHSYVYFR